MSRFQDKYQAEAPGRGEGGTTETGSAGRCTESMVGPQMAQINAEMVSRRGIGIREDAKEHKGGGG
ncbi:hypothetical protein SY85_14530 [Flavisolibacter tropicus]|uniref:Uncharacterized protein n=1 Tax=Flavisolibacter tropicus TaxID=1492898 RepID=A0A172TWX8_9BACT|nr:hypothetical protein SY85_14530 [Flavisolibacter tropicus]